MSRPKGADKRADLTRGVTAVDPAAARPGRSIGERLRRMLAVRDGDGTPCALVVMGVSGSGKSTIGEALAHRLGWLYEDGDKFHPAGNIAKMSAGQPLTDEDRWPWLHAIANEIDRVCASGGRVVIGCSALKRAYRDILVHGRDDIRIVHLDGTQQLIASRLGRRKGHFMPPGLLASQFATLEAPGADEHPVIVSIDAPVDRIVDNILRQLGLDRAESGIANPT